MTSATLMDLSWYLPDTPGRYRVDQVDPTMMTYNETIEVERFLFAYRQPKFGWLFTKIMHQCNKPLPGHLDIFDHDLYRLHSHLNGRREPIIIQALALAFAPSERSVRLGLESLLLTKLAQTMGAEASLEYAADFLKMPLDLVRAYEKLFFNIADRLDDEKFIIGLVYPHTRVVEHSRNYIKCENVTKLLYRAAYNHGETDLKQMLGFRDQLSSQSDAKVFAEKLEGALMASGLFMAKNGYMHDSSLSVINSARQLIAATKAGGVDTMGDTVMSSLGDSLQAELRNMRQARMLSFDDA